MMSMKSANSGLQLVQVSLKLMPVTGGWDHEFSSSTPAIVTRNGDLDFSRIGEVVVCITLVDSPDFRFLADPDACIGFSKQACPQTSNPKDHDVFKCIAVSEDGQGLSFLDLNNPNSGDYFYALFLRHRVDLIVIDPRIKNR